MLILKVDKDTQLLMEVLIFTKSGSYMTAYLTQRDYNL